jgi:hypothetical protein
VQINPPIQPKLKPHKNETETPLPHLLNND